VHTYDTKTETAKAKGPKRTSAWAGGSSLLWQSPRTVRGERIIQRQMLGFLCDQVDQPLSLLNLITMSKRSLASAFSSPSKAAKSNTASAAGSQRNFSQFSNGHSGASSNSNEGAFLGSNISQAISPSRRLVGSRPILYTNGSSGNSGVTPAGNSNGHPGADDLLVPEKLVNDPIHSSIKLDKLSCRIIDTPQYQRLRHLKQLGTCCYVFPSAGHTRFEHSLGVAHLSERLCQTLQRNQPELGITDIDILAVKIAGLCHDLGHGPFSHVYDGVFIKTMFPNGLDGKGTEWRHEDGSVEMFKYILKANGIILSQYGLSPVDQIFIEEIIGGERERTRKGRAPDKFYLYDVVNNTRSGLDVDKLDYFQRDMRNANVIFSTNFERFIELGRVIRAVPVKLTDGTNFKRHHSGGWITSQDADKDNLSSPSSASQDAGHASNDEAGHQLMVCYPQKLVFEAIDMFSVRFRMHKTVYTHKAAKQVEFMVTDILQAANDHLKIKGTCNAQFPDGMYKISECIFDMEALSNLNDSVIEAVRYDQNPNLAAAKAILKRLEQRKLYVCLGKSSYTREDESQGIIKDERVIALQICEIAKKLANGFYEGTHGADVGLGIDGNVHDNDLEILESEQNRADYTDLEPCSNSQDSIYSVAMNQNSQGEPEYSQLDPNDIIVEKMHIHYGLKDKNPVSRMRFFQKNADGDSVGEEVSHRIYHTSCPSVFEEFAVRVFCRTIGKEGTASKAFGLWCKDKLSTTPFQSQLQEETEGFVSQV